MSVLCVQIPGFLLQIAYRAAPELQAKPAALLDAQEQICALNAGDAMQRMTAISGIGPWTAEVYLLISAGHADIFPAKDIALQAAVAEAFALEGRPTDKELYAIAEAWSPWRGVASRLFWAYYREMRGRDAALGR